ncbi:phage protease [Diaphorobacter sp.]|uniref:phage protease n=1 Tax=Diaphorobacter sp. TaxID=1934310 RepID=UPI00289DA8DA|nr:phage protease [Diaphorobacter sp.]
MSSAQMEPIEPAALKPGAAVRILPAGVFQSKDGRPASVTQGRISHWRMDATNAAAVLAARRNGESGFVIDYEHQTLNKATNGQPAPAAGWFQGLEWREGQGLFMAQIEWTERARAMIAGGEYRYLSPVFGFDSQTGAVTYIHSVALTNDPALIGLADLAAATAAPHQSAAPHATISEEDRANFKHVFGDLPGLDMDAVIAAAMAAPPKPDTAKTPINAEDRAKFKHVFGDMPGLDIDAVIARHTTG